MSATALSRKLSGYSQKQQELALLVAMLRQVQSPVQTFVNRYHDDPVAFVLDCFEWGNNKGPTAYQQRILGGLNAEHRAAVRGPHGLGKTAMASWVLLWFALTRDLAGEDWKIPTTASAWRQLTKFLWPEIKKWARRLRWDMIPREPFVDNRELLSLSLKLGAGEAFALASNQPELIEGAHADQLLYVFDESKAIPDATWDSAEGAFSTGNCYWLAISTPGEPQGRFYDIHTCKPGYEDWHAIHVTLQDAIEAGRITAGWADARKRQWGEDSAVYQNRVLGEFAANDESGVIPLSWVEQANARWQEWQDAGHPGEFYGVGVDVGRGGDASVYAIRYGNAVAELRRNTGRDTMTVAGIAAGILRGQGSGLAIVDVIGVGAGVVDRLREQRFQVEAFNAGSKADGRDSSGELGFVNRRSQAWWHMRELLDPQNGHDIALPPDDQLTGDLTAPHWRVTSGGKVQIESKDDIRKRLGRSTDCGDAVVQVFAPMPQFTGLKSY